MILTCSGVHSVHLRQPLNTLYRWGICNSQSTIVVKLRHFYLFMKFSSIVWPTVTTYAVISEIRYIVSKHGYFRLTWSLIM